MLIVEYNHCNKNQIAKNKFEKNDDCTIWRKIEKTIALYQESLELKEKIGDMQGKAATLAMMGQLLADTKQDKERGLNHLHQSLEILVHLQSPDARVVQSIIQRIKTT